jgi:hypothetical protein
MTLCVMSPCGRSLCEHGPCPASTHKSPKPNPNLPRRCGRFGPLLRAFGTMRQNRNPQSPHCRPSPAKHAQVRQAEPNLEPTSIALPCAVARSANTAKTAAERPARVAPIPILANPATTDTVRITSSSSSVNSCSRCRMTRHRPHVTTYSLAPASGESGISERTRGVRRRCVHHRHLSRRPLWW